MDYETALAVAAESAETADDFVEIVDALLALRWPDGRRLIIGAPTVRKAQHRDAA